ncbi:unnamed protein product, partial [Polarella glacialis]
ETGFLNYFGLQRFGLHHATFGAGQLDSGVGSAIISSRWKEAVHLILGDAGKSGASASTSAKRPAEDAAEIAAEAAGQVAKVARTASAKDESIDMPPVTKDESESGSSLAGAAEEPRCSCCKEAVVGRGGCLEGEAVGRSFALLCPSWNAEVSFCDSS